MQTRWTGSCPGLEAATGGPCPFCGSHRWTSCGLAHLEWRPWFSSSPGGWAQPGSAQRKCRSPQTWTPGRPSSRWAAIHSIPPPSGKDNGHTRRCRERWNRTGSTGLPRNLSQVRCETRPGLCRSGRCLPVGVPWSSCRGADLSVRLGSPSLPSSRLRPFRRCRGAALGYRWCCAVCGYLRGCSLSPWLGRGRSSGGPAVWPTGALNKLWNRDWAYKREWSGRPSIGCGRWERLCHSRPGCILVGGCYKWTWSARLHKPSRLRWPLWGYGISPPPLGESWEREVKYELTRQRTTKTFLSFFHWRNLSFI